MRRFPNRRSAPALAMLLGVASLAAGAVLAAQTTTVVLVGPPGPWTGTPRPLSTPAPVPPSRDWQEEVSRREALPGNPYGNTASVSGELTRGSSITVRGVTVRLPADAYVQARVEAVLCSPGQPCPETPFYVLRRGPSTITVAVNSGAILREETSPGDDVAFQFLKKALQ